MNKMIAGLMAASLLFTPTRAIADEAPPQLPLNLDLRITDITKGGKAPFAGILLTPDAMAKIEYDHKLALSILKNKHSFALQRIELKFEAETALRLSERQMHEEIFTSQIRRIESLEEIAISKRPDWVMPVAILTSFIVGAGVTVGITYAVNQ